MPTTCLSQLFRKALVLCMLLMIIGVGNVWGAEDDTHDFSQSISQGLNNCATFSDIVISEQTYTIKSVKITYAYNKSNSPSATVKIGETTIGTETFTGTGNLTTYETLTFSPASPIKGAVTIIHNSGSSCSGKSKGTLKITNVQLVEGASAAPAYTITAIRNNDSYGTVEVSGTTITATPAAGYKVMAGNDGYTVTSGSAMVVNNGDNTFTVTPSSNCTVQINFESKGCTDHYGANVVSGNKTDVTANGPVDSYYKYSTRQILYTRTDLGLVSGKKGTIKSIYFEYAGAEAMDERTIDIYMANTALTNLSTSNCVPFSSFTQVYSGTFSCGSAGWYEIELTTDFEYNGLGNLVVLIDDNTGSYQSSKYFKYHNAATATGAQLHTQSDTDNENPATTNYSETNYRPNTKFCIQEADMAPSTVTLMDNGATITEASAGAGVTLPSRAGCTGYTFAGWTKTWTEEQDEWTTTAPTIIPAGSYTPSANENLYPVYTKTEAGSGFSSYTKVTSAPSDWSGQYLLSTGTYTATGEISSSHLTRDTYTPGTTEANAREFTLTKVGTTGYSLKIGTSYIGYANSSTNFATSSTAPTSSSTGYLWTPSTNGITNVGYSARKIADNGSSDFRPYSSPSSGIVYLYKRNEGGSTTSYISVPNCCTPLGSVNGSINVNNATSVTLQWDAVTGAEKYQVKVPGSSSHNDWTDAVSGVSVTKSCGTAYTAYFRAIDTNGSHCSEGPESTLAIPAVSYTVEYSVTNGSKTSGDATTCGPLTAVFSANSGYHLPDKAAITVTGASDFSWTKATGTLTINAGQITGNINISFTCPADACADAFSLHTGTKGGSDWLYNKCFSDADWGAADDAIWVGEFPSTNECYVGYAGGDSYHGAYWAVGGIKTYNIPNGRTLGWNGSDYYSDYPATALGTFHIYKNSTDANYYLRFKPSSYILRTGSDGTSWTSRDMTVSGINSNYYESDFVTLTSTLISEHAYVSLKANNVNGYVWCNFSNDRTASGNVKVKNGASTFRATDLQASDNGTYGKFQIDITQDVDNWKLAFVPYFHITYNANGGTGSTDASSYVEVGSTAAAAVNGFTAPTGKQFGGWATSADGSKAYDPTDAVTLNSNVELFAVWTDINYTVTVNQNPSVGATTTGQTTTAHYNGTINLTTTVPSGYRFVNWTTSDGFSITNSTSATTASFTMPAKNVTVTANFQQTHTVTWMNNGSNYGDPVVYDHGAALAFPAGTPSAPSSCSEKVFVGWTSDPEITSETSTEPTLITAGGAVNTDLIYRAVFADEEGGETTYNKVTSSLGDWSGEYLIVHEVSSTSGKCMDGSIVSGSIDANYNSQDVSISSGSITSTSSIETYRWIVESVIGGYNIKSANQEYYIGNTSQKSKAAANGLTTTESSSTDEGYVLTFAYSNSKTTIKASKNGDTYLVYNNSPAPADPVTVRFRFYKASTCGNGEGSGNYSAVALYKKTGGISYDNYITQCCALKPVTSLAVSGTTANSVTLSWTAPSPTTGIDHLELRNVSTDAKIGSNIAVGTTSTTVSGLVECNTYSYKIVSVGASCETSSEVVDAQPFSGAKTITYKYHDDVTADGSFTTDCSHTSTNLPNPSRTGYTLNGWYTDASGGTKKGDGGAGYTPDADITLHAQWSQTNYTVTMQQSPTAGATLTGGTTTAHYGGTINISTEVPSGYRFTGWTSSPSVTFADASAASTSFTMPDGNVTVTANFVQTHAVSFSVPTGGGTVVSPPSTIDHGGTLTFPNVTDVDCGTFLGWTTAANSSYSSTSTTPTPLYAAAATTTINDAATFYAVYSKVGDNPVAATLYAHDGDVNSITNAGYTNTTITATGIGTTSTTNFKTKFDDAGDNVVFDLDGTPTSFVANFKVVSSGNSGTSTITLSEYNSSTSTWDVITSADGTSADQEFSISVTTPASFSQRKLKLAMTAKAKNVMCGDITINGLRAPITYTTTPSCVDWRLQSIAVTTAPTKTNYDECEMFDPAGMVVTATMYDNDNPETTTTKAVAGYTWTPEQFLTPGNTVAVTISYTEKAVTKTTTYNVRVNDLPNYTITFHDGGNTTTWTQSNHCDACNLDSRTGSLACGDYTFAGWSTSSTSYDDENATITTWVSGSYTPTANTHLYAVYRKGAAAADFTANCDGGTYTIGTKKGGSTIVSRAANVGSFNSYEYGVANLSYTEDDLGQFTFEKVGENQYKISLYREDDYGGGIKKFYVGSDDYSAGSFEFFETYDADQCKWKVVAGTYGTWRIYSEMRTTNVTKDYGIAGRNEDYPRFRLVPTSNINGSDNYDLELTPVASNVYQSNPNCASTYTITFNTHGGSFVQGNYAYATETTSGLSGTTTSKFPSATLSGCTFVGWKEGNAYEETTSSAAEDDMSDAPYGLFAADANLSVSSNKTYHAVYHYYDDDIEFDPIEGGTYHMYATVEGVKHFCSAAPGTSFGTIASSTDCEDVVDVVVTPGTGENADKYKINIGGYDVTPELTNTGLKRGTFWWNISEVSENLYHITADGAESGRSLNYYSAMSSFTHYKDNGAGNINDISFGRCRQHHWTSEPTLTPLIILSSDNVITVTSAKDQAVKSITKLKVSATHFGTTTAINLSCNIAGVTFNPASLSTGADGEMAEQEVDVIYTPTAYPPALSDGISTGTITAQDANVTPLATATRSVKVRNLPAQFVIAAKAGSEWVALTAKITGMATQDAIPIIVDNTTTPTKATVAMNTSEYSLLGLPSTNSRFATNGGAVHLYSSQTSKVLNSSTSTGTATYINTGATAANAATSANCLFYEWKLVSSDLVHYTITNSNNTAGLESHRILGYSATTGKWGMYSVGSNQDIFLLPIEEVLTDLNVEVMEWGASSMALRFDGTVPASLKVTLGGSTSAAKTLTAIGEGSDLWKIDGLTLNSHDCEVMQLTDGTDASKGTLIRKPILVNSEVTGSAYRTALTDETCANCDIVILNGGKLSADQGKDNHTDFAKIYVYPGGKLVLNGYSLGAKQQVYVRGGYSWLNTSAYALPELYIKGTIKFNGSAKIIYDYYIQNYKYYQFALPYTVQLSKVTDEAGVDDFPVWVKHYNGALRAANANATSWEWYEGENFEAGVGYIIAARPRQVDKVQNRPLSIIRFPLSNNAFTGISSADYGEATKSVSTTAHGIAGYEAGTVTANNVGWNYVGNPFMATWKGDIGHKQLVKAPDDEHWNGSYKWDEGATKYITVMAPEDGTDYDQYVASTKELQPFFPFFFQETAGGGSGTLEFSNTGRIMKAPAIVRAEEPREAFVQIDMTNGVYQDQTGMYVGDKYSDELDFDDMQKVFGSLMNKPKIWLLHENTRMAFEAMSEERASGNIPVGYRAPEEGEYVFSLSEYSNTDYVEAVRLNDNIEGVYNYNLLENDYSFTSDQVVYNDTRFTISIEMKANAPGTATGTEMVEMKSEKPLKFIWQDKMYILRNGVIYDATGKQVKGGLK